MLKSISQKFKNNGSNGSSEETGIARRKSKRWSGPLSFAKTPTGMKGDSATTTPEDGKTFGLTKAQSQNSRTNIERSTTDEERAKARPARSSSVTSYTLTESLKGSSSLLDYNLTESLKGWPLEAVKLKVEEDATKASSLLSAALPSPASSNPHSPSAAAGGGTASPTLTSASSNSSNQGLDTPPNGEVGGKGGEVGGVDSKATEQALAALETEGKGETLKADLTQGENLEADLGEGEVLRGDLAGGEILERGLGLAKPETSVAILDSAASKNVVLEAEVEGLKAELEKERAASAERVKGLEEEKAAAMREWEGERVRMEIQIAELQREVEQKERLAQSMAAVAETRAAQELSLLRIRNEALEERLRRTAVTTERLQMLHSKWPLPCSRAF